MKAPMLKTRFCALLKVQNKKNMALNNKDERCLTTTNITKNELIILDDKVLQT
jgi:hypothetical protein